jgi:hypothetical protein
VSAVGERHHADPENPYAGQGSVLLDIGDDVGALVVEMPRSMLGVEVEVRPVGDTDPGTHHPHVAVVDRQTPLGPMPSLVFGALAEGAYELYERGGGPVRVTAAVRGGGVTEATWPE